MKRERGGFRMLKREQLLEELVHDSYKDDRKPPEPARCPGCGACWRKGRWTWDAADPDSHDHLCPACRRIRDDFPAGFVTLAGPFLEEHREEIQGLVKHCESDEKARHPLQRIMAIKPSREGLLITTTDVHLARSIAERVHGAYQGELEFSYNKSDNLLRASWSR